MGNKLTSIKLPDDLRAKIDEWRKEKRETLVGAIIAGLQLLLEKYKEESEGKNLTDEEIIQNWREAESVGVSPFELIALAVKERRLQK